MLAQARRQVVWAAAAAALVLAFPRNGSAAGLMLALRELDDRAARLQSGVVGFHLGPFVPLVSYDRYHAGFAVTLSRRTNTDSRSATIGADVVAQMPAFEVKLRLGRPDPGSAVPFLFAVVGKPMLRVRFQTAGDVPPDVDERLKQLELQEAMPSMWLFRGAVGGDYMVSHRFAITAEVGLQYVTARAQRTDSTDWDGDGRTDVTASTIVESVFDATYTSLGVTYYFGSAWPGAG